MAILILGVNGAVAVNGTNTVNQNEGKINEEIYIKVETGDNEITSLDPPGGGGENDGKNDFAMKNKWYGYKLKFWLDHENTEDLVHAIEVDGAVAAIIMAATGAGALPAACAAGIAVAQVAAIEQADSGQGVKIIIHATSYNGVYYPIWENIKGQ
ncbi:MAG: hypothetical protein ACLFVB_06750 [Thermoplasmata archaeon]